jgi:hypothetical protein
MNKDELLQKCPACGGYLYATIIETYYAVPIRIGDADYAYDTADAQCGMDSQVDELTICCHDCGWAAE